MFGPSPHEVGLLITIPLICAGLLGLVMLFRVRTFLALMGACAATAVWVVLGIALLRIAPVPGIIMLALSFWTLLVFMGIAAYMSFGEPKVVEPVLAEEASAPPTQAYVLVGPPGTCPNCKRTIPTDSPECAGCRAVFGEGSTWQVEPQIEEERFAWKPRQVPSSSEHGT